ncbi:high affinity methionine permease [Moniliophthora roreri]|nr:high affinity methionine permease [Moniliophthora roreri]
MSSTSETDPLLPSPRHTTYHDSVSGIKSVTREEEGVYNRQGESFDNVPSSKRHLGLSSAAFLIFNRVIGTGIYATPSVILKASGSVGMAFMTWLVGALIAAAGTTVFMELGTGLPRSGGEKNYLEFMYRRPRFLMTCVYSVYAVITGFTNSSLALTDILHALAIEPTRFNTRFIAFLCLTFIIIIHGAFMKWGLRLQNTLGLFKLVILSAIALCGFLSLAGIPAFAVKREYDQPDNFRWGKFWEGTRTDANAFVSGLYNVIWSFVGYSTANYALSEVRDPVRTLKRAAPLAMTVVTAIYLFINIGYFAVVSKADILNSKRIVAYVSIGFRQYNLIHFDVGPCSSETYLVKPWNGVFIALSTLGNLLAGQFGMGRVIQELGREGLLPFSSFFASNKPFNAPLAGLFTQYVVSCAFMILPPPGDAYLFMISLASYCAAIVNLLVSLGLLLLYTSSYRAWEWNPPFRAHKVVVVLFFISNVFLVAVPLIPPAPGSRTYEHLPYWSHTVVSFGVSLIGVTFCGSTFSQNPASCLCHVVNNGGVQCGMLALGVMIHSSSECESASSDNISKPVPKPSVLVVLHGPLLKVSLAWQAAGPYKVCFRFGIAVPLLKDRAVILVILRLCVLSLYNGSSSVKVFLTLTFGVQTITIITIFILGARTETGKNDLIVQNSDHPIVVLDSYRTMSRCRVLNVEFNLRASWVMLLRVSFEFGRSPQHSYSRLSGCHLLSWMLRGIAINLSLWPENLDLATGLAVAFPSLIGSRPMINVRHVPSSTLILLVDLAVLVSPISLTLPPEVSPVNAILIPIFRYNLSMITSVR